ncbi:MAG: M20 family metallo-hydrolase [Gemmataceae bacterium]|nr:M20 family metallo-hydrolase [Gemmataceae bacterium]
MTLPPVHIDLTRLTHELEQLAQFSDADPPAVTRILFTESDRKARAFLRNLIAEAGLVLREDSAGNLFARWVGAHTHLPPVATGSHVDAIPFSGRYDGTVGVLGALEAIRSLKAVGWRPLRSVELLVFTSEEPTRFGIGCLGSRLLSGALAPAAAAALKDASGATFDEVRRQAGCIGALADVPLPGGCYAAFVELHIEQGPLLEREQIPIGAVTAIAAPAALRVQLEGEGGHAGAVLMPDRKDALCAAAEVVLAVEEAAKSSGRADTVATTGVCQIHPGAINSIPGRVTLGIDVRDTDLSSRDQVVDRVRQAIHQTAGRRGLRAKVELLNADPPAEAGPEVLGAIQAACRRLQLACRPMVSRAYHDALFMARLCPMGMIFIPCKDGVSHRPDEYSSPEAIGRGVEVLALALAELMGTASD